MPTYKVIHGKRTEFLHAKNEAQLMIAVREVFGDEKSCVISAPSTEEMNALMRSHSCPPEE